MYLKACTTECVCRDHSFSLKRGFRWP